MGRKYYSLNSLPEPFDVVWCRYPLVEDPGNPGLWARPTLVWQTKILEDDEGTRYGAVTVSYGGDSKGEKPDASTKDLIIDDWGTVKKIGLHKPTRFSADPNGRPEFIWGPEYFVPPEYLRYSKIVIGRLDDAMVERLKGCLKARGV